MHEKEETSQQTLVERGLQRDHTPQNVDADSELQHI